MVMMNLGCRMGPHHWCPTTTTIPTVGCAGHNLHAPLTTGVQPRPCVFSCESSRVQRSRFGARVPACPRWHRPAPWYYSTPNSFNWQPRYFQSLSQHTPLCFPVWWDLDFPTLPRKWKHIVHLHFIYLFGTEKQDTAITLKCCLYNGWFLFGAMGFPKSRSQQDPYQTRLSGRQWTFHSMKRKKIKRSVRRQMLHARR